MCSSMLPGCGMAAMIRSCWGEVYIGFWSQRTQCGGFTALLPWSSGEIVWYSSSTWQSKAARGGRDLSISLKIRHAERGGTRL